MPLLKEKSNCWKVTKAKRGAFLIDAENYFSNLYHALGKAQKAIYILGWDIDSRIPLIQEPEKDIPHTLGKYLKYLVKKNPELNIYILAWDFYPVFVFEREFFMRFSLGWRTPKRIHFILDNEYPIGASQHQKVVVIDDEIAFCGGLDLTTNRWDTTAHKKKDIRRVNPSGGKYPPFHDVQMMVQGRVAHHLGRLARKRWFRATGEKLSAPDLSEKANFDHFPWNFAEAPIGIARTEPRYKNFKEIREVERLYIDLIRSAQKHLYFENQYFTSKVIHEELKESLVQEKGPEITIVLPAEPDGWLEQNTMGVLRNILLKQLKEADKFHRLGIYFAAFRNSKLRINIHSKVMIADNLFARVGSSNLSNRSLGLDSECDLLLDASSNASLREAVQRFKARLIGEHIGASEEEVEKILEIGKSVNTFIEQEKNERGLFPFEFGTAENTAEPLVDADWLDLERPLAADIILDALGPHFNLKTSKLFRGKFFKIGIALGSLFFLFVIWRFTGLRNILSFPQIQSFLEQFEFLRARPEWMLGVYALSGICFLPFTLLVLITATIFPFGPAILSSIFGAVLSATVSYIFGRLLGRNAIRKLFYKKSRKIATRLNKKGILPIVLIRLVPVAPYTVLNFIAGAFRVNFRTFLLGTFLGLLPGIFLLTLFQKSLLELFSVPDISHALFFVSMSGLLFFFFWQVRRRLTVFSKA